MFETLGGAAEDGVQWRGRGIEERARGGDTGVRDEGYGRLVGGGVVRRQRERGRKRKQRARAFARHSGSVSLKGWVGCTSLSIDAARDAPVESPCSFVLLRVVVDVEVEAVRCVLARDGGP